MFCSGRAAAAEARAEARAAALNSRIGFLEARLAGMGNQNGAGIANPFESADSLQERVASVEEVLLRMSATLDRLADPAR